MRSKSHDVAKMDPPVDYLLHPPSKSTGSPQSHRSARNRNRRSGASLIPTSEESSVSSWREREHHRERPPSRDQRNTVLYTLRNAASTDSDGVGPAESLTEQLSFQYLSRLRHIMESKAALTFPPVSSLLCILQLFLYLKHDLFNVESPRDIYVSWQTVWEQNEYWRLFVAPFFHFGKLHLIVNIFTLFAVGRYLERKVSKTAFVIIILAMGSITNFFYILINPYFCTLPHSWHTCGFGNIIYSLRVLLAYALEPRNYEKDLVFGLYPMVVSASHAPWQPILDLIIFKLVLPEQCVTGQLAGILAGFVVTAIILIWPAEGIYIASPPYYWTLMGSDFDPSERDRRRPADDDNWKIGTYSNSDFWLPTSSESLTSSDVSRHPSSTSTTVHSTAPPPPPQDLPEFRNGLEKHLVKVKKSISFISTHPVQPLKFLAAKGLTFLRSSSSSEKSLKEKKKKKNALDRSITGSATKILKDHYARMEEVKRKISGVLPCSCVHGALRNRKHRSGGSKTTTKPKVEQNLLLQSGDARMLANVI